jgi:hypothetical protein
VNIRIFQNYWYYWHIIKMCKNIYLGKRTKIKIYANTVEKYFLQWMTGRMLGN